MDHDGPPELPARTPDSFILLDQFAVPADKSKKTPGMSWNLI